MRNLRYHPIRSVGWSDYELIDSGNSRKLERFGQVLLDRFEPESHWAPNLETADWLEAHRRYIIDSKKNSGHWEILKKGPEKWTIELDQLRIALKLSASRHVGIFPEQVENWRWIKQKITNFGKPARILNLFAYTGVATLYCASAGAQVTNVDASRSAIETAKISQDLSNLRDQPIRWIKDDVTKFVAREIRRGVKYDAIILDPPKFGRGPKGEIWKFEKAIEQLLALLDQILSNTPIFFLLTAYNIDMDAKELANLVKNRISISNGNLEFGPIMQIEKSAGREINQAVYVRQSTNG